MAFTTNNITAADLLEEARKMKRRGYRFVTLSCVDLGEALDVIYHFDKDLEIIHTRVTVPKGETVPSISEVYFAAVIVENETQDHFGIKFDGIALDFGGHFYLDDEVEKFPFCKVSVEKKETAKEGA
jgi:ech hydrogenase subunit D